MGGAINFIFLIAWSKLSASCFAILDGRALGYRFACSQICFVVLGPILENSVVKNDCRVLDSVDFSMLIRIPNSIPSGCGLISFGFTGRVVVALEYSTFVPDTSP